MPAVAPAAVIAGRHAAGRGKALADVGRADHGFTDRPGELGVELRIVEEHLHLYDLTAGSRPATPMHPAPLQVGTTGCQGRASRARLRHATAAILRQSGAARWLLGPALCDERGDFVTAQRGPAPLAHESQPRSTRPPTLIPAARHPEQWTTGPAQAPTWRLPVRQAAA